MKFTQTFAPIATLALAVSGASTVAEGYSRPAYQGGAKPVSFSKTGLQKIIDAKSNGDFSGAKASVLHFFNRNPTIINSIMKVAEMDKHSEARGEIITEVFKPLPKSNGKLDISAIEVHGIDFIYKRPHVLNLIQEAGKQVIEDHPTLVENFQTEVNRLAHINPATIKKFIQQMIEFSDKHNDSYEHAFEMVLKSALLDPKLSAKVAKGALKIDQMICEGSGPKGCSCDDDYTSDVENDLAGKDSHNGQGSSTPNSEVESSKVPETSEPESINNVDDTEYPEIEGPFDYDNDDDADYIRPDNDNQSPQNGSSNPQVDAPEANDTYTPKVEEPTQYSRPSQA